MENIRVVMVICVLSLLVWITASPALAYGNDGAHQGINQQAFFKVKTMMQSDSILKKATLYGDKSLGAIDENHDSGKRFYRNTLKDWLIFGGYAADTPNLDMALNHLYDQTTGKGIGGSLAGDSAVNWVTRNDNPYSFMNGKKYFLQALEDTDRDNYWYGMAWRSVGESMHMVSDMTVPAHVRNDAHPFYEPYERLTTGIEVINYAKGNPSTSIDYNQFSNTADIKSFMVNIAKWTHDNFYSEDTIPPELYSPELLPDKDGYYHNYIDGNDVVSARKTLITIGLEDLNSDGFIERQPKYGTEVTISDSRIISAQQRILIPNAIHASALVLWVFLPRFEAVIDKIEKDQKSGQYIIYGQLKHYSTPLWQTAPEVKNGAFLEINNVQGIGIKLYNNGGYSNLNNIKYAINAEEGDTVRLYYDFGGYKIISDPFVIQQTETQPTVTVSRTYTREECKEYYRQHFSPIGPASSLVPKECNKYKNCWIGICDPVPTSTI